MMNRDKWQAIGFPLIILALSVLLYSNTLHNDFVYDDFREVRDNQLIQDFRLKDFVQAFFHRPGQPMPPGRPVPMLTYAVNFRLGGLNPIGYHAVNIILHALVSLLVYGVGIQLFSGKRNISFIVAALFAVHPIHPDVVDPISGRSELLAAFCFMFSLWIYLRKTPSVNSGRSAAYWLTLPVFLIGALSKATAWSLPLVIIGCDFYRFNPGGEKRLSQYLPIFLKRLRRFYLLYFSIPVLLFAVIFFAGYTPDTSEHCTNFLRNLPLLERVAAVMEIFAHNLFLLLFPVRLSCDYSFAYLSAQPVLNRLLWTVGGLAAFIGGVCLAVKSIKNKVRYFLPVFIMGATYVIVSNLFLLINTPMAERLLYLPSWGFCIFLGMLLEDVFLSRSSRRPRSAWPGYLCLVFIIITALYSIRTWDRNQDWRDQLSLMRSAVRVCPTSGRVQFNLGQAWEDSGNPERARFHYRNAVAILPSHPNFHLRLGIVYNDLGERDLAVKEFRESIKFSSGSVESYFNMGVAHSEMEQWQEAVESFRLAAEFEPNDPVIYNKMAIAYWRSGDKESAVGAFRQALVVDPLFRQARKNLEIISTQPGPTGVNSESQ